MCKSTSPQSISEEVGQEPGSEGCLPAHSGGSVDRWIGGLLPCFPLAPVADGSVSWSAQLVFFCNAGLPTQRAVINLKTIPTDLPDRGIFSIEVSLPR